MGYTQNCEILHGTSLGTLIMSQEKTMWSTMWGLCFGHKRAIFWPFLGKGDYGIHPELWNLAWSILGHYYNPNSVWNRPINKLWDTAQIKSNKWILHGIVLNFKPFKKGICKDMAEKVLMDLNHYKVKQVYAKI